MICIDKEHIKVVGDINLEVEVISDNPKCLLQQIVIGVENAKKYASTVKDKKDFKFSIVTISNIAYEVIVYMFGMYGQSLIIVNGTIVMPSYDIKKDDDILYHYSYISYEMGGKSNV